MISKKEISYFLRIVRVEFKTSIRSELVYRWRVFFWVLSDALQPFLFAVLWSAVVASNTSTISQNNVVSYYFMVAIVSKLTKDWSIELISTSIINGEFSKYLIRPFNYLAEMLGINLAIKVLRISFLVPILLIASVFIGSLLEYEITIKNIILFILSVLLAFMISFVLGNIFALTAFFVKQIIGMKALYVSIVSMLSGEYIPLAVFPASILVLLKFLPFRYTLSFPIEIIMGLLNDREVFNGFIIGILWLITLSLIYKVSLKYSIRKYESEGI